MLSKIVFLIFVGILSVASTVALAAREETIHSSTKSLAVVNSASGVSLEKQVVKAESNENHKITPLNSDNNDKTLPETGWLLAMALFGFVMLSNRTGI